MPPMREVPGWRVAWFHPRFGHWKLGLYEHRDYAAALAEADFLPAWLGEGVKAAVIECTAYVTGHGAEAMQQEVGEKK